MNRALQLAYFPGTGAEKERARHKSSLAHGGSFRQMAFAATLTICRLTIHAGVTTLWYVSLLNRAAQVKPRTAGLHHEW